MIWVSRIHIMLGTILMGLILGPGADCQTTTHPGDHKWEVSVGAGYFSPARQGFREYYGSSAWYETGATYRISSTLRAGAHLSHTRLRKSEYPVKFTMLSFVPVIQVTFRGNAVISPYLGGGMGYYRGKVSVQAPSVRGEFSQSGAGLKGYAGVRFAFRSRLFLAIEGTYCRTFLGDPYKGDFGNIGGFSGLAKSGIMF